MRRILVHNARRKTSPRHGGDRRKRDLNKAVVAVDSGASSDAIVALDAALERLSNKDKAKADVVRLRHFVGLTIRQVADILGISPTTAKRYWIYSRAWLLRGIG